MENHVFEIRIPIMAMATPAAGANVHFHIALLRRIVAKAKQRIAKIRSALRAAKTRMKHEQPLTVQGSQLIATQTLMLPDGLKQAFRRNTVVIAQDSGRAAALTAAGVEVGGKQ
jgi:hypothetical protein